MPERVERVGIECALLGGPTAVVPAESYKSASWTMVCYYSAHRGGQMAPGKMEHLASVSESSASGGDPEGESPPKLMPAD